MNTANYLPETLSGLIARIEGAPIMNNELLLDFLAQLPIRVEDIESYSFFNHPLYESYGRREVFRSERLKIFVMSWNPGDFTAIHDHEPDEWGAVLFFGNMAHRLYALENGHLVLKQAATIPPGIKVGVTGSLIHAMGNQSDKPALTLHIYGSNSKLGNDLKTLVYELERNRIILTDGSAFLNRQDNEYTVVSEVLLTNEATLLDHAAYIQPFFAR
jgi:hypothetical protein